MDIVKLEKEQRSNGNQQNRTLTSSLRESELENNTTNLDFGLGVSGPKHKNGQPKSNTRRANNRGKKKQRKAKLYMQTRARRKRA